MLGDKSLLQHVYYNSLEADLVSKVVIATDDERIAAHCEEYNMDYVMTSEEHKSGTDRIAEAVEILNLQHDYIVNVQGDEPFIQAKELNLISGMIQTASADIVSLYQIKDKHIATNKHEVKVVTTTDGQALYFSRSDIPFSNALVERKVHIGVYGFRRDVLTKITKLPVSSLESAESLEQLRWLENGYSIRMAVTEYNGFGIDTPEDLTKAIQFLG